MKKYIIGMLAGYLLTSIFSIPPLPSYFWFFISGLTMVVLVFALGWWKLNNDLHEGDF